VYYVLSVIWPPKILPGDMDRDGKPGFEMLAANEGFFDHENVATITGVLHGQDADTASSQETYVVQGKEAETQGDRLV